MTFKIFFGNQVTAAGATYTLSADGGSYSFSGTAATLTRIRVTWNPSDKATEIVLSNSNLTASTVTADTAATVRVNRSHNTGKWYFEGVIDSRAGVDEISFGLLTSTVALDVFPGFEPGSIALYDTGTVFNDSVAQDTFKALDVGERVGIAVDFDAGKFWNRDSTGWYGDPAAGTGAATTFTPNTQLFAATQVFTVGDQATANFGNGAFTYTVPAGFLAWDEETIRAEAGSYTYSGTDATLTKAAAPSKILSAEAGSYAFAGQDASLERGYVLVAETFISAGGSPIGLLLTLTGGGGATYTFSGSPVDLTITATGETVLDAEAGSYAVSGTAATLTYTPILVGFVFTGSDATLTYEEVTETILGAEAGSFNFAGQEVTLDRTFRVIAAAGAYSFAGQDTTLDRTYKVIPEAGSYSFSGTAATLTYTPILVGFVFTGTDAELTYEPAGQTILGAAGGSFQFSGSDATLTVVHALELAAEAGAFSFTGSNATLTYTPTEPVAPGYWQDPGASDAEFWVRKWREQARALKPVPKPTAVYEPTVAMAEAAPAAVVRKTAAAPDPEVVELVDFVRLLEKL